MVKNLKIVILLHYPQLLIGKVGQLWGCFE